MDPELSRRHKDLQEERRKNRIGTGRAFAIYIVVTVASGVVLFSSGNWSLPSPVVLFVAVVFAVSFFATFIYGLDAVPYLIWPLEPVDKAFEKLYGALDYIEPRDEPKQPITEDASKRRVERLVKASLTQLQDDNAKEVLLREAYDHLKAILKAIEENLVPAIPAGKVYPATLEKIAAVLANPSLEGLNAITTEIEQEYRGPWELPKPLLRRGLLRIRRSAPSRIGLSLFLSIMTVFLASWVYTVYFQVNYSSFLKDHPEVIFLGWVPFYPIYYSIFRKESVKAELIQATV